MISFFNWTDTDFTYAWNGKLYSFEAGKVYNDIIVAQDGTRLLLDNGIQDHFARHLSDQVFNLSKINPDGAPGLRIEHIARAKALPEVVAAPVVVQEVVAPIVEAEPVKEKPKNKGGRPKKVVEATEDVVEEAVSDDTAEFEA